MQLVYLPHVLFTLPLQLIQQISDFALIVLNRMLEGATILTQLFDFMLVAHD
jgi:hypothetical protein